MLFYIITLSFIFLAWTQKLLMLLHNHNMYFKNLLYACEYWIRKHSHLQEEGTEMFYVTMDLTRL